MKLGIEENGLRCVGGAAGLLLADRLRLHAMAARPARAKAVIQIWMWGGPSHLDTFDPKPDAGPDYHGPLGKPLACNVDGMQVGELLPLLAKQADKYSFCSALNPDSETISAVKIPHRTQVHPAGSPS